MSVRVDQLNEFTMIEYQNWGRKQIVTGNCIGILSMWTDFVDLHLAQRSFHILNCYHHHQHHHYYCCYESNYTNWTVIKRKILPINYHLDAASTSTNMHVFMLTKSWPAWLDGYCVYYTINLNLNFIHTHTHTQVEVSMISSMIICIVPTLVAIARAKHLINELFFYSCWMIDSPAHNKICNLSFRQQHSHQNS